MSRSVAHLLLYKNNSKSIQRKAALKEECRNRLRDIRMKKFNGARGILSEKDVSDVVYSSTNPGEFREEDEESFLRQLCFDLLREEEKSNADFMAAREREEIDWMENPTVICVQCNSHPFTIESDIVKCANCGFSFSVASQLCSSLPLLDAITSARTAHSTMALYDEDDEPREEKKSAPSTNIGLKFLQTQMHQRRSAPTTNLLPSVARPSIGIKDLTGRARTGPPTLRPVAARPLSDTFQPIFIPKAAVDEKINMFGEITVEREYQPAVPNDYYMCKKRREERETRERIAREVAERLEREHKEEMKKREKGAAFAPPSSLNLSPPRVETKVEDKVDKSAEWSKPAPFKPFGQSGKGLGVAASIMSKMGYREGAGLGRDEQGIAAAIQVERTGGQTGKIVAPETGPPPAPMSQQAISEHMKKATKILLLKNMVALEEVDDELEPEIADEMSKYGQVAKVIVHKMVNASEGDQLRIFIEFTNVAQAIKAFIVQSGRFFAGRPVQASFYPLDQYNSQTYES